MVEDKIEKLSNVFGIAGREDEVRDLMKKYLEPYVDEVRVDNLGNVIGIKRGEKQFPKVMLAAHMDEVGLLIKSISKEGFLRFAKIGGIDDRILLAHKVIVYTKKGAIQGIIGSKPPHLQKKEERKKAISHEKLFIDVGAENKREAEEMGVRIGDPVGFDIKFAKTRKDTLIGKAFDDRAGCAVMLEAVKRLKDNNCTVCAVGTVQEEVGVRGATTAAFGIRPEVGIAIDTTVAGGVPGVKEVETPIEMRKGPSITVADRGLITHPKVLRLLIDVAEDNKIPHQMETGLLGSTDASRISISREGVPSGVISIPTRYIHSPVAMLSLKDVKNAVKLTVAAIQKIPEYF
ncbi:MAG: M42 family metallopeptidase [Thermoproteota archaeon]